MINGAHVIINSKKPEADCVFLRDVLRLPHVDVGRGWLIFGLPPAEVAVHPSENNDEHQLYFMCEDVEALIRQMSERDIDCEQLRELGWGLLTQITLPGGGKLGIYEPRHARPKSMKTSKRTPRRRKSSARRSASKSKNRSRK